MKMSALCFVPAIVLVAAAEVKEWHFPDGRDFARVLPAEAQPDDYRDGFRVTADFICDLEAFDQKKCFGNIVTQGRDFDQSFSVMIRKSGDLMVNLKGCDPEYEIIELGLKSGERYRLEVVVVPSAVRVSLDGKVCGGTVWRS